MINLYGYYHISLVSFFILNTHLFLFLHLLSLLILISLIYFYLDGILSVASSPDGKYLATSSYDKSVNLINVEERRVIHRFDSIHTGN